MAPSDVLTGLTAERLRELVFYDPDTGVMTRRTRASSTAPAGAALKNLSHGYLNGRINGRLYLVHRLAWLYVNGVWPNHDIDHINGDRADNRILNLRDVPRHINGQNQRRPHKNSITGLLGAGVDPRGRKKYRSVISTPMGKSISLGYFETAQQAHEAYIEAKRRMHLGCTI